MVCTVFYSCKKEEPDTEAQSAIDNSICEGEFTRIGPVINEYAINQQGIRSGCPAVTADTILRTMEFDYGTAGCQDTDEKQRKGKITAKFSGKWNTVNSTVTIKLQNYQVENRYYACDSIVIKRNSSISYTTSIIRGKCWTNDWNLEWAGTRTMTQIGGAGDLIADNDIFEFSGNANGRNRKGKTYTVTISIPIQKKASCKWIDKGRLDLTPEGLAARTID